MNFGKLYNEATKLPKEEILSKPESQDAARAQARMNWLNSTITKEVISSVHTEMDTLLRESVALAVNYPKTNNHQQIIQNLVRVDTLRKQVETYVNS